MPEYSVARLQQTVLHDPHLHGCLFYYYYFLKFLGAAPSKGLTGIGRKQVFAGNKHKLWSELQSLKMTLRTTLFNFGLMQESLWPILCTVA